MRSTHHELVHGVCEERWAGVVDLYAEQTDVSHPFHPLGAPPMRSREALRAHFGGPQPSPGPTLRRRPTQSYSARSVRRPAPPDALIAPGSLCT